MAVLLATACLCACGYSFNDVSTPYDGMNLKKYIKLGEYRIQLTQTEIDNMLESERKAFLKSFATVNLIGDTANNIPDRAIKKGDNVTISTEVKVYGENGELIPLDELLAGEEAEDSLSSALKDYTVEDVGNGYFLPEIENALIGSWTGYIEYVDVQYDDKVQTEQLKNKKVQITVIISKVQEVVLPEYTDEFVASKTDYDTVAEFETALTKDLILSYIWNVYNDSAEVIKYPTDRVIKYQTEFTEYYDYLARSANMTLDEYLKSIGTDIDGYADRALSYAQGTVKEEMVLYYTVERENLGFTGEEYKAYANSVLDHYGSDNIEMLENTYGREMIRRAYYWELAKDFLYENLEIKP